MQKPNSKNPNLTPDTEAFVKAVEAQKAPPLYTLTPEEARKVLLKAQSGAVAKPEADIRDFELDAGNAGHIPVRIVCPKGTSGTIPAVIYLHGGGWVMGNAETHDRLLRELATRSGAAMVFPTYTASPEAYYPQPLEQAYATLKHIAAKGGDYGLDTQKIAVAGDSAGGNMAAALTLLAKQRKGPRILFQLLLYPVTDASMSSDSYNAFSDGPWLSKKAMAWFWDAYAPDKHTRGEITVSPLLATREQLAGLPPTLVITAENDVLRDEGEAFAQNLSQAGVDTVSMRMNGAIHDFMMLNALAATAPAKAATCIAGAALSHALK